MRNRTISAHTEKEAENKASKRDRDHKLVIYRRKIVFLLLSFMVISAVTFFFIFEFITSYSVSFGDSIKNTADVSIYKSEIDDYLKANPFQKIYFILNSSSLQSYMQKKSPEINSIDSLKNDSIGHISLVLTFRKPIASWKVSDNTYYVDNNGIAFARNFFSSPQVVVTDNSGIKSGSVVASSKLLSFIGEVADAAKKFNITVNNIVIPEKTTHEIEVFSTSRATGAFMTIDRPVGDQVEDMYFAFNYFTKKGTTPTYADVRVAGEAFYK
jgi:hypothetical protein